MKFYILLAVVLGVGMMSSCAKRESCATYAKETKMVKTEVNS